MPTSATGISTLSCLLLFAFSMQVSNLSMVRLVEYFSPLSVQGTVNTDPRLDGKILAPMSKEEEEEEEVAKEPSRTLVVVRCHGNLTWLDDQAHGIPSLLDEQHWQIVIYNKCVKKSPPPPLSEQLQARISATYEPLNAGAEECNGYLDYFYDYYEKHSDVTVFMHDDGLAGWSRHKGMHAHTPFEHFGEVARAANSLLLEETSNGANSSSKHDYANKEGFLHMGVQEILQRWGVLPYHGLAQQIVWTFFNTQHDHKAFQFPRTPIWNTFKPGAHMILRKDAIERHHKDVYFGLLQQVRTGFRIGKLNDETNRYPDARTFCCALETTWHMFFGLPPIMPKSAMASDLFNYTECSWCHKPERAYQAK